MIGRTVAHYEIQAKLGAGAMGEVYLAFDTKLGRKVALKFLPESLSTDHEARTRLLHEAQNASQLNHPNVVTIHAIENVDSRDFIVMEFIEGQTLKGLLESGPVPFERVVEIGGAICDGLAAAHEKGIIHRDIKPDNIFLTARGHVKIADFGIARSEQGAGLTRTGMPVGTVAYMSPEQARGEKDLDSRSDLFSFGSLLYEMATGERPFKGEHLTAVLYELLSEDPPAPSSIVSDLSRDFDQIVLRALAKSKDARFKSAVEIGEKLRALKATLAMPMPAVSFHRPEVHYAHSGDVSVAYSILGEGPIDLVFVGGWVSNIELYWTHPIPAEFLRRLMSFCRLIIFDKRGTGLSDNVNDMPTLEQRMDDVRAVMDAAGSERAVVFGVSEGGSMSALFAATYPERTHALVLFGAFAKRIWDPEYPWAPTPDQRQKWFELIEHGWGGIVDLDTLAPSLHRDEEFRDWWSDYLRQSARPRAALDLARMNTQIDIRHLLPSIRVPTLILHRVGDRDVKIDEARYLAAQIPGAVLRELPGNDHLAFAGNHEELLSEVESFVRRIVAAPPPLETLTTVVAVHVQGKTGSARLTELQTLVEDMGSRFRAGTVVAEGGHVLATFDGPARAVRCAQALMDEAGRLHLRLAIGIHIGSCAISEDRVAGIAARVATELSDHAQVGQVVLSGPVRDLTAGSGLQTQERESISVRSWPEPLRIYELPRAKIADDASRRRSARAKVAMLLLSVTAFAAISALGYMTYSKYFSTSARSQGDARKTLAVLPFENLGSPEQEYFADGLTEEVISKLSGVSGLSVISRTSVMPYKRTKKKPRQIADDLGVDYLMEGSVQWAQPSNRFKITARLVAAEEEISLWNASYDTLMTDVFAVQAEIAQRVTGAMHITLVEAERQNLVRGGTKSPYALMAFYRGNTYFHSSAVEDSTPLAISAYEEAVRLDTSYVQAWARLSRAHAKMVWWGFDRGQKHRAQAKLAMDRAVFFDVEAPETQLARGFYYYWVEKDNLRALQEFGELEHRVKTSEVFDVYTAIGYVQRRRGEFDKAIAYLQTALNQDPDLKVKDAAKKFAERAWELGFIFLRLRRWAEADQFLEQARSLAPNEARPYAYLARVRVYGFRDIDSARAILDAAPEAARFAEVLEDRVWLELLRHDAEAASKHLVIVDDDTAYFNIQKAWIAELRGDDVERQRAFDLARSDLEAQVKSEPNMASLRRFLGVCYAGLGRGEDALREGNRAMELVSPQKDAFYGGPSGIEAMARIQTMLGNYGAAVDLLDSLLSLPAGLITPEYLRIAPEYDALRGNPHFEMLLSRGQPTASISSPADARIGRFTEFPVPQAHTLY